jgi:hypothetical protein
VIYREAARKLAALGCREVPRRGGGAHRKWTNPATTRSTVLPITARETSNWARFGQLSGSWAWTGQHFSRPEAGMPNGNEQGGSPWPALA